MQVNGGGHIDTPIARMSRFWANGLVVRITCFSTFKKNFNHLKLI